MGRTVATEHTVLGSERVTSRYQHGADLAPLLLIERSQLDGLELTVEQWSALIDRWNRLPDLTRKAHRKRCTLTGHERVRVAGNTPSPALICRTCLEYMRLPETARVSHAG